MQHTVSLKEFRQDVAKYAKRVDRGEELIVTNRSKPLFRLSPVDDAGWETVIDFTKFRKDGIEAKDLLRILRSL